MVDFKQRIKMLPISVLELQWSFSKVDGDDIVLQSGLRLPSLSSLEKISINGDRHQELNEDDVIGLLNYGLRSERFEVLGFYYCKLPEFLRCDAIPPLAKIRNVKVMRLDQASQVDMQTGKWTQVTDIEDIRRLCSDTVAIDNDTSESVQRSVIDVLMKAASHGIPIFSVDLSGGCFHSVGVDGSIHLNSGISLPILSSLEGMVIETEIGREIDEYEANGILNHLTRWERLEEVTFEYCLLPPLLYGPFLSELHSRDFKVYWCPYGSDKRSYLLDLQEGLWLMEREPVSEYPDKEFSEEKLNDDGYDEEVERFRDFYGLR